ncbi:hypothetical protein AeMF1_002948, partial [Aphanomyces euteiches]
MDSQVEEFFKAVRNVDTEAVKTLLDSGFDVNTHTTIQSTNREGKDNSWEGSALMYASRHGHTDMVRLLLAQDRIDVNAKQSMGWSALILAAANGHGEIVQLLLNCDGFEVNLSGNRQAPLHYAAIYGCIEIVEILLRNEKVDPNVKRYDGSTPLHSAVKFGQVDVVKMLLEHGSCDLRLEERYFGTVFEIAAAKGHVDILKILFDFSREDSQLVHEQLGKILQRAAGKGHLNIVQMLMRDFSASIDFESKNVSEALREASEHGHVEIVRLLLQQPRINTNWSCETWGTALQSAARNGHSEVIEFFLANAKVESENLGIALHRASYNGYLNIVALLLAHGDQIINYQNKSGESALHCAANKGHVEIVRFLLKRGIDINLFDEYLGTALHKASGSGHLEIVQMLLKHGIQNINCQNKWGRTALHAAAQGGRAEIVQTLLNHDNIDPNLKSEEGHTALDIAIAKEYDEVVRLLLECSGSGLSGKVDFLPLQRDFEHLIEAPAYAEPTYALQSGYYDIDTALFEKEDTVHFTAYAPPVVALESEFDFFIWAFLANQRDDMEEQAIAADSRCRQLSREMMLSMRRGAVAHIHLQVPDGFLVLGDGPNKSLHWHGKVTSANYCIQCTSSAPTDQVMFEAKIVVGTNVMVLKSFVFVSSLPQLYLERSMTELKSHFELIPQQYEEIPYQDLNLKELVGQGHFGDAYRAEYKGKDVVVKTLKAQTFGESSDDIVQEFRHEATALSMFGHHPNIVPFVGASTDLSQPLALVTAYLPYGSLSQYLSKNEMTIEQKQTVLKDAAAGLLNIHEGRFIHRDMAARNLLIDGNLQAKICDFGMCRRVDSYGGSHFESGVGPLKYMGPESLSPPHSFSYRSDAYSFGVLMWETFTEVTPYKGLRGDEAATLVLEGKCLNACADGIPAKYIKLMARCFY